jgi:Flp pilus assembly protein TadG/plastocyanin
VKFGAHRLAQGRLGKPDAALSRASQRGQSLTELALILPVILLLTVIALDFGRVYLGYVNLQNMARIAANYAANNPLAWSTSPDEDIQARYARQVLEDATVTNCTLPVVGGETVVPDPVFTDVDLDGISTGLGDTVRVGLTCHFTVITPLVANILGGTVAVSAESNFPVKAGMTAVLPAGSGGSGGSGSGVTIPPSAAIEAGGVFSTDASPWLWLTGPTVTVQFRDASGGGAPTSWAWNFGDGGTATSQDATHTYTCTVPDLYGFCKYLVEMTASNAFGHDTDYLGVLVEHSSTVNFAASPTTIDRGQTVTFTDASTAGGTSFRWDFGDGQTETTATGTTTHTFATSGTYSVHLWVTYPDPVGERGPASKSITVNPGYCTVPSLKNVMFEKANEIWQGAPYGFSGNVERAVGAPKPPANFKITAQSITAGNGATAPCSSDVFVSSP